MKAWLQAMSIAVALLCGFNPSIFAQSGNLYNQLVEMAKSEIAKKGGKVTIAINWTNPQGKET